MGLLVVVAVAEPHGLPASRPTVGHINNLEEKTGGTEGALMRGLRGRGGRKTRHTSAEQIHRRCARVHKLPSNNVSLLSKFMGSLCVKQETMTLYQRAASCTRCQPLAWQSHGESYERFLFGQTAVKAAVANVWHINPLCQMVVPGARILEWTKEHEDVLDWAR